MAAPAWYDDPITNPHSHDDGVDIGTPNDTPLYFPGVGQVIDASYHVYGGQVVVHMPDGYDEYFIHMNRIDVHPGDWISAGEEVGTSGGGVGDLVLHNGHVQPAQAQSWYEGHSDGYHSEFGEFQDNSPSGSMSQFNQGWGNKSRQRDPTGLIQSLRSGLINLKLNPGATPPDTGQIASSAISSAASSATTGVIDDAVKAFGFSSPQNALQRIGVGVAGLAVILVGLYVAGQPEIQTVAGQAQKAAGTAAKAALL